MPFIQNVAKSDVAENKHLDPGANSMLISINDPATFPPDPKHKFKEIHHFEFLDIEDASHFPEECMCSMTQAEKLVDLLNHAIKHNMNVIVHCTAGICRSGAVVEVGGIMGFDLTRTYRQPNLLVKKRMMQVLGLAYDESDQQPYDWEEHWTQPNVACSKIWSDLTK